MNDKTVRPIQWTIPRVEEKLDKEGYYRTLNDCDDNCHHPIHAFHPERKKHLIEADLVEIAIKNNWWNDVS